MKRLILGALVVFGLVASANAEDKFLSGNRLFSGEDLEKYEDLKKRWEVIKETAKNTETFGECDKDSYVSGCSRYTDAKEIMEKLEYADAKSGEIGAWEARKATVKKYKLGLYRPEDELERARSKIVLMEAKLMEIGAIKSYNEFKSKMAKCRLSGKICVEE